MIWVTIVFALWAKLLELDRLGKKRKNEQKNSGTLPSNLYCSYSSDQLTISKRTSINSSEKNFVTDSSNQNIQKHGENLGIETNHKWQSFLRGSRFALYAVRFALYAVSFVFFLFFLCSNIHWFIFLHFDPVQIILLLWALHRFSLLSFTFWIIRLLLSWLPQLFWL